MPPPRPRPNNQRPNNPRPNNQRPQPPHPRPPRKKRHPTRPPKNPHPNRMHLRRATPSRVRSLLPQSKGRPNPNPPPTRQKKPQRGAEQHGHADQRRPPRRHRRNDGARAE